MTQWENDGWPPLFMPLLAIAPSTVGHHHCSYYDTVSREFVSGYLVIRSPGNWYQGILWYGFPGICIRVSCDTVSRELVSGYLVIRFPGDLHHNILLCPVELYQDHNVINISSSIPWFSPFGSPGSSRGTVWRLRMWTFFSQLIRTPFGEKYDG